MEKVKEIAPSLSKEKEKEKENCGGDNEEECIKVMVRVRPLISNSNTLSGKENNGACTPSRSGYSRKNHFEFDVSTNVAESDSLKRCVFVENISDNKDSTTRNDKKGGVIN